jgi:NitT/TauT family transport system substrate-binding protein
MFQSANPSMNPFRLSIFITALLFAITAAAQERLLVSVPGPLNISYLPLDLAPMIGADRAEGVELVLQRVGGGGVALNDLRTRKADFAVAGVPAAISAKARGHDVVVIAPVNDLTLFILMVRDSLKASVKSVRDLEGHTIGVNSSSLASKTTSQQLAELLVKNAGVPLTRVRFVAAGQNWEEQSSAIRSGAVDAILGDEPFASRLRDGGEVFFLVNLANPADAANIPGAGFLHAAIETRSDVIAQTPHKAEKMVAVTRRTLAWMASHTPEQIVEALRIGDAKERQAILKALQQYPRLYSPDARFSAHQTRETDVFFTSTEGKSGLLSGMIDARWAGQKP